MNKFTLYIFSIIILIALWFTFFNTSPKDNKPTIKEEHIKTSKDEIIEKKNISHKTQIDRNTSTISSNKLDDEIKLLLAKAEKLLEESKDEEAIKIYNLIIKKTNKSIDPILLEHFTTACMTLGYIYQIYPNIDNDAAMESYMTVINKFEKSTNVHFIQYYIDAELQITYLLPYDERMEIYNELLSKFGKNDNKDIQKRVETLLINKSFQLMGKDNEEAMQVLDKVIENFQERNATTEVPENVSMSILNNIELALITNNESDTYVDLAEKLMSNSPDTKPLLEMLEILKNSQDIDQDEALAQWKNNHKDYRFENWSFQEVERWAYHIEDQETKERVTKYINAFVKQKYNSSNQYSNTTVYENSSDSRAKDIDPYAKNLNEDTDVEEDITDNDSNEETMYSNDIDKEDKNNNTYLEVYPDPYKNSESSSY